MTQSRSGRHPVGGVDARGRRSNASASSMWGRRNAQPMVGELGLVCRGRCGSATRCARPASRSIPASPAVCGSCSRTMSPARTIGRMLLEVLGEHLVVVPLLGLAQRAAVTGHPVQDVVQALGDGGRTRRPRRRTSQRVCTPAPAAVGQQRLEHLGDAPPCGRRVDVPHGAPARISRACVGVAAPVEQRALGPAGLPAGRGQMASISTSRMASCCHGCAHGVPVFAPYAPLASLAWALPSWRGCATSARRSSPRCRRWPPSTGAINLGQGFPDTDGPPRDARGGGRGDPRRAQPVPARARRARAAARPSPRTSSASTASTSTPTGGAGHGRGHRGDRRGGARAVRAGRRGRHLRALLRLLRRHDRAGRRASAAHVGAAVPRLRRRRGRAAGGVLAAHPAGAAQHPAQPDRQGLHPRASSSCVGELAARARRVGGHRRGLRAPGLRRRASTSRWPPCPGWRSAR